MLGRVEPPNGSEAFDPTVPFASVPFVLEDLWHGRGGVKCNEASRLGEGYVVPHDGALAARFKRAGLLAESRGITVEGMRDRCTSRGLPFLIPEVGHYLAANLSQQPLLVDDCVAARGDRSHAGFVQLGKALHNVLVASREMNQIYHALCRHQGVRPLRMLVVFWLPQISGFSNLRQDTGLSIL